MTNNELPVVKILTGIPGPIGPKGEPADAVSVKSLYESNEDTNAFTDLEKEKLARQINSFAAAEVPVDYIPQAGDIWFNTDVEKYYFYSEIQADWIERP